MSPKLFKTFSRKKCGNNEGRNGVGGGGSVKKQDIFQLIERERWDDLRTYARTDRGESDMTKSSAVLDFVDQNVFHRLCTYHPPADVVEIFLHVLGPDLLGRPDATAMLPLHIAVSYGANLDVVEILLEGCRGAARMKDARGMTPLACLADNAGPNSSAAMNVWGVGGSSFSKKKKKKREWRPPDLAVFRALIHAHPVALIVTDEEGRTPVQLAEESLAPQEVIDGLRADASRVRRALVKRGVLIESSTESRCDGGWGERGGARLGGRSSFRSNMGHGARRRSMCRDPKRGSLGFSSIGSMGYANGGPMNAFDGLSQLSGSSLLLPSQVEFPQDEGTVSGVEGEMRHVYAEDSEMGGMERRVSDLSLPELPEASATRFVEEGQGGMVAGEDAADSGYISA